MLLHASTGYTAEEADPEVTQHFIESDTVVCGAFKAVDTGEVVGAALFLPATCRRTTTPIMCGGSVVVRPDFGAKGLGSVMMEIWQSFAISCGYDAMYMETHTKHAAMLHLSLKKGMRMIGCVPDTIKLPTCGWGDTILLYLPCGRYVNTDKL